jgi:methylmalonyl-CoA mutase N-terminal domain/subunit
VERIRALRPRRNRQNWQQALKSVEEASKSGANLMPHIIHAVENYATVGEISDTLRRVFGEYQETVVV